MTETETETERMVLDAVTERFGSLGVDAVFADFDASDIESSQMLFTVDEETGELLNQHDVGPTDEQVDSDRTGQYVCTYDKFGFESSDNSDEETIEHTANWMYAAMAKQAVEEIYHDENNAHYTDTSWVWPNTPTVVLNEALSEATTEIRVDYDPDTLLLSDVLATTIDDAYMSKSWGEIVAEFEDAHDVDVVVDEYNLLRGADVVVVDSDRFGYRTVRTYPDTSTYVEYENYDPRYDGLDEKPDEEDLEVLQEITQVHCRVGYKAVDRDAAHIVRFGKL